METKLCKIASNYLLLSHEINTQLFHTNVCVTFFYVKKIITEIF
jgi:hypothetical protein